MRNIRRRLVYFYRRHRFRFPFLCLFWPPPPPLPPWFFFLFLLVSFNTPDEFQRRMACTPPLRGIRTRLSNFLSFFFLISFSRPRAPFSPSSSRHIPVTITRCRMYRMHPFSLFPFQIYLSPTIRESEDLGCYIPRSVGGR